MTDAGTKILKEGRTLPQVERLSIAIALLEDGGVPPDLFNKLRDQVESVIAIERCKRLDSGIDQAIPYEEALNKAKSAVL